MKISLNDDGTSLIYKLSFAQGPSTFKWEKKHKTSDKITYFKILEINNDYILFIKL